MVQAARVKVALVFDVDADHETILAAWPESGLASEARSEPQASEVE